MKRHISIFTLLFVAVAAVGPVAGGDATFSVGFVSSKPCTIGYDGCPEDINFADKATDWYYSADWMPYPESYFSEFLMYDSYSVHARAAEGLVFEGWYTVEGVVTSADLPVSAATKRISASESVTGTEIRQKAGNWKANTQDATIPVPFVVAKYVPIYTITTAVSPSEAGTVKTGGVEVTSIKAKEGSSLTLTAESAAGYAFKLWKRGGVEVAGLKNPLTFTVQASETYEAVFTGRVYTVTFNKQNGTGGSDSVKATYLGTLPKISVPTKTGYSFGGYWLGETQYYDSDGKSVRNWDISANKTLSAVWMPNDYSWNLVMKTGIAKIHYRIGSGEWQETTASLTVDAPFGTECSAWAEPINNWYRTDSTERNPWKGTMAESGLEFSPSVSLNGYSLTIDPNGGKYDGSPDPVTYSIPPLQRNETNWNEVLPAMSQEGKKFRGYRDSSGGGELVYGEDGKCVDGKYWLKGEFIGNSDLRVYAWFQDVETAQIAATPVPAAAGSVSGGGDFIEIGTEVTLTVTVTNMGYSFCCWTNLADVGETGYGFTTNAYPSWKFTATEGASFAALFTGNVYRVDFMLDDYEGTVSPNRKNVQYGQPYGELPIPSYKDENRHFLRWKDSAGNEITAETFVQTVGRHTLDAESSVLPTYTIAYDGNGATSGLMSDQTVIRGVPTPLAPNGFKRTGHTFLGWATEKDGGKVYDDQAEVTNLVGEDETATLYAVWQANAYTVRFNANGGEGEMADQPFVYDVAQAFASNAFTKVKNSFAGWAKTSAGPVAYADGEIVSNLTAVADETVTLYAKWEKPVLTNELSIAADCEKEYDDGRQPLELIADDATWCTVQEGQDAGGNGKYVRLAPSDNNAAVLVSERISGTGRLMFSYKTSINPGAGAYGSYLTLWTNGLPCEDFKITATSDQWVDYVYEKTSEESVEVTWAFTGEFCETLGDYALVDYIRWIPDGAGPTYAEDDTPVTGFSMSDGQIGFSFAADGSSTYHIFGTNDVAAPWPWPFVREIKADETQPVRIDIKADEPKMFYRIRALIP